MNILVYNLGTLCYEYQVISNFVGLTSTVNSLTTFIHNINKNNYNLNKELVKKITSRDIRNGISVYEKLLTEIKLKLDNQMKTLETPNKILQIQIDDNHFESDKQITTNLETKSSIGECINLIEKSLYNIHKEIQEADKKIEYNKSLYLHLGRTFYIDNHLENIIQEYDILLERLNMLKTCCEFRFLLH